MLGDHDTSCCAQERAGVGFDTPNRPGGTVVGIGSRPPPIPEEPIPRRTDVKFLCLAYGKEADWVALPEERREELLRQDDVLRQRGAFISVVGDPTVVRAWDGPVHRSPQPYALSDAPLVGFSIIEAADLDEAVGLVAQTPCAVARGAIEIRPLVQPPS